MTGAAGKQSGNNYEGRDYSTYEFLMSQSGQRSYHEPGCGAAASHGLGRTTQPVLIDPGLPLIRNHIDSLEYKETFQIHQTFA